MSEDEIINYINFIFLKEDYIIEFLARLNNYRTIGKLELSVDLFNTIKIIFDKAADYLMIKSSDRIYNFLIILSQTFYIVKNNEKYFLQKELLHKEFFRSVEFWNNKLDKTIDEEIERLDEELAKNGVELNENKKNRKKEEILFTKFVSFIASLNGFELEKEKIDKILFPLFEKYNVKEEMKNSILSLLNVYKNNN
jgi:predicted HTH domain antitoxin